MKSLWGWKQGGGEHRYPVDTCKCAISLGSHTFDTTPTFSLDSNRVPCYPPNTAITKENHPKCQTS